MRVEILRNHTARSIAVLLLIGLAVAAARPAHASSICPPEADACLIVNGLADTDMRDGALTLREAVALSNGDLVLSELTAAERSQVLINSPAGLTYSGSSHFFFDSGVFVPGQTHIIQLRDTGLALRTGPTGANATRRTGHGPPWQRSSSKEPPAPVVQAPPDLGRGPGGGGGVLARGLDPVTGAAVAVSVTLDGTGLAAGTSSSACLTVEAPGFWIRGLTFDTCQIAVGVSDSVAAMTTLGSNGDGVDDDLEALHYVNCDATVVVY